MSESVERVLRFEQAVITHPHYDEGERALSAMLQRAKARRSQRDIKARACLLYGPSGAGKTTMLERFVAQYPDETGKFADKRRIILLEAPDSTTKRALVGAIMNEYGYQTGVRDSANTIISDIVRIVDEVGTEMIIIDEAHHILSSRDATGVSEFVKSLLNRVGCSIVLAGLPIIRKLHEFEQLDRRLMPDIGLEAYSWTEASGRLWFLTMLHEFEQLLNLPRPSYLANEGLAMRIYLATSGSIGLVSKLLSRAFELALTRKLQRIDKSLLAEVYASWKPASRVPARIDFTAKLLVENDISSGELAELASRPTLDSRDNPFECTVARCNELWAFKNSARTPFSIHASGGPSRRARGPDPVTI